METGSGLSTIVLLLGAHHTSISPDGGEAERIREYCEGTGSRIDGFTHVVAEVRGRAARCCSPDAELDLIIVDGNHTFPAPMIDWFYMTRHLRTGGVLVVDDVELWTGRCWPTSSTARPGSGSRSLGRRALRSTASWATRATR